jgi:hypothetical protein
MSARTVIPIAAVPHAAANVAGNGAGAAIPRLATSRLRSRCRSSIRSVAPPPHRNSSASRRGSPVTRFLPTRRESWRCPCALRSSSRCRRPRIRRRVRGCESPTMLPARIAVPSSGVPSALIETLIFRDLGLFSRTSKTNGSPFGRPFEQPETSVTPQTRVNARLAAGARWGRRTSCGGRRGLPCASSGRW